MKALKERFSDSADVQLAMQRLKRVKQGSGESVQSYAEKIIDLAEEAFNTLNLLLIFVIFSIILASESEKWGRLKGQGR